MTLGFDQNLDQHEQSAQGRSVVAAVVSLAGETFTIEELKNLRSTCRLLKQLVDPWFKKLKIDVSTFRKVDADALAASSVLVHLRDLDFVGTTEDSYIKRSSVNYFWLTKQSLFSVLSQCSPRLERLVLKYPDAAHRAGNRYLQTCSFPSLTSLKLYDFGKGTISSWRKALCSMTSLKTLGLSETPFFKIPVDRPRHSRLERMEAYNAEDAKALAEIPFVETLMSFLCDLDGLEEGGLVHLASLFQRAANLTRLELHMPSSLQFFDEAPFENLKELGIFSVKSLNFLLIPCFVVHLAFGLQYFGSTALLAPFFTSGNWNQLKSLVIGPANNENTSEDINWAEIMRTMNFPKLKSLVLGFCPGLKSQSFQAMIFSALLRRAIFQISRTT